MMFGAHGKEKGRAGLAAERSFPVRAIAQLEKTGPFSHRCPVLYDTHAHLDYPDFASEIPQIIQRAKDVGVIKIITIGTTVDSSERAIRLAAEFNPIYAVVGWHPSHCTEAPSDVRSELRRLA